VDALADPWTEPVTGGRSSRSCCSGDRGGALGCWVIAYRLSYSAESLAHALLPGLVIAALAGVPLLIGGAAGLVVAALAIAVGRPHAGDRHDTAVAVVVTALLGLGALLALSPDTPAGLQEPAVRRHARRLGRRPRARRRPGRSGSSRAARAAPAPARVGFDRTSAGALGIAPGRSTSRSGCCSPPRSSSPCRASATCWSSRC
jgi:hypothetical protein